MVKVLSEEHKAKLLAARKANKEKLERGEIPKNYVGCKDFIKNGERFELLYSFEDRSNLCIYRRTHAKTGKFIAIEAVYAERGKRRYPTDEEFGQRGWCFTGTEESALQQVKTKFRLNF